jgi:hypothetical protein
MGLPRALVIDHLYVEIQKYSVTEASLLVGTDMWVILLWFGPVEKSLRDVLHHDCIHPGIKFTVELEQDEALLFMFVNSNKQEGSRLWTKW